MAIGRQELNQSVLTDISEATETSEVTIPGGTTAQQHRNASKTADDFCRFGNCRKKLK
jgi:hypothetical protein